MRKASCFIIIYLILSIISCSVTMNIMRLYVYPEQYDFAEVPINRKSDAQSFVMHNIGLAVLNIEQIIIRDDYEQNFQLAGIIGSNEILIDKKLIINVKFTPKSEGEKNSVLHIAVQQSISPINIPLTGTGVIPIFTLTPDDDPYDFGYVPMYSGVFQHFILENNNSFPVKILSIKTQQNANFVAYSTFLPTTIPPDCSIMFLVAFNPTSTKETNARLVIEHDSANVPITVELQGIGTLVGIIDYLPIEDFDGFRFPAFWKISGTNYTWQWGEISGNGGISAFSKPNCVGTNLQGNYADFQDNRLESPIVDLRNAKHPILSFWQLIRTVYDNYGDGGLLEISTNDVYDLFNDATWSPWKSISNTYPTYNIENFNGTGKPAFGGDKIPFKWHEIRADLTPYIGKYVKIGWRFISDGSQNDSGWFIDNVHIFEIVRH